MLSVALLAPLAVWSSHALANNRYVTAGYYDYPELAFVRIRADAAQELQSFLSATNDPTKTDQKKLNCTTAACGFVLSRGGQVIPVRNVAALNIESEKLSNSGSLEKGDVELHKPDAGPKMLEVTVSGMAAQFLFNFLDTNKDSTYDIKVQGLKCSREPVSNTYECTFKVADNGGLAP